jgi:hypothetical protein
MIGYLAGSMQDIFRHRVGHHNYRGSSTHLPNLCVLQAACYTRYQRFDAQTREARGWFQSVDYVQN